MGWGSALSVPAGPGRGPPGSQGPGRRVERGRPPTQRPEGLLRVQGWPRARPASEVALSKRAPVPASSRQLGDSGLPGESRVLESSLVEVVRCGLRSEQARGPRPSGPSFRWPRGAIAQRFQTLGTRAWPASPAALVGGSPGTPPSESGVAVGGAVPYVG